MNNFINKFYGQKIFGIFTIFLFLIISITLITDKTILVWFMLPTAIYYSIFGFYILLVAPIQQYFKNKKK